MELELLPVLMVFLLFAASGGAYFAARKSGIPHSVLLVAIGVGLVALSNIGTFDFLRTFTLTPELLFYIFLPALIFESAYNINIRALTRDTAPIALLSIVSLLISALVIAAGLYYLLPLAGFPIPFIVAFVFGSLISATDPVAVLALFKEYGAPRRLALLFEGESLFNDGTGFALFLIALEFAIKGGFAAETVIEGTASFVVMLVGGTLFGLLSGSVFTKIIGSARTSESVSITLMLVLAHVTFLLSELISHTAHIGGFDIHLSSIIATTVAAMVLGNYGRAKLPHGAEEFIEKFWGQVAFLANSIVFILIGMLAISLPINSPQLFIPIAVVVLIVAVARAISVYSILIPWNTLVESASKIPMAWQHLLAWGSLRGALAVTMALLVPTDLVVSGWSHDMPVQSVILAFTTGCIFVTLFFKATTIGPLMHSLHVGRLSRIETAEYQESRSLVYARVLERLNRFSDKGYISRTTFERLRSYYENRLAETRTASALAEAESGVADAVLRIWVLGIERSAAKDLYTYGEISEYAYRRILAKLSARTEDAEDGISSSEIHIRNYMDVFEHIAEWVRRVLGKKPLYEMPAESYMYYRALVIISHKVEKELARICEEQTDGIFSKEVVERTKNIYLSFATHAQNKMRGVAEEYPEIANTVSENLARYGILKVEEYVLNDLIEHQMVSSKVHATLRHELEEEVSKHALAQRADS